MSTASRDGGIGDSCTLARLRIAPRRGGQPTPRDHLQQREEHWAIVDLVGKAAHIRTVPVPDWVKAAIDGWLTAASITEGRVFRCVTRRGTVWGHGITEKVIWHVVKN